MTAVSKTLTISLARESRLTWRKMTVAVWASLGAIFRCFKDDAMVFGGGSEMEESVCV
mgnify:CR=1 FL=1